MKKREFLSAAALAGLALPGASQAQTSGKAARGPLLLTIGGAIGTGNRGPGCRTSQQVAMLAPAGETSGLAQRTGTVRKLRSRRGRLSRTVRSFE
jgi:hypothetical protein